MAPEPIVLARPRKWLFPVVLVVLQEESSYGYEIMQRLAREFGFEQMNPGAVYRTLRQMEKEGLCDAQWETSAADGGHDAARTTSPPRGKHTWTLGSRRIRGTGC